MRDSTIPHPIDIGQSKALLDNDYNREEKNNPIDWIPLIKWLLVCFAYGWWAVIVVYFGLLAETASLYLQVVSLPVIVASLALARLFQMAMNTKSYGFASLFFSGLLVAGMLA